MLADMRRVRDAQGCGPVPPARVSSAASVAALMVRLMGCQIWVSITDRAVHAAWVTGPQPWVLRQWRAEAWHADAAGLAALATPH